MIYRVNTKLEFDIEADSRADAHLEAVNRLIEADLAGFDLISMGVIRDPVATDDHAARGRFTGDLSLNTEPNLFPVGPEGAPHVVATNSGPEVVRPDFSSLDPTPLRVEGTLTASEPSTDERVDRFGEFAGRQDRPTV